MKNPLVFYNNNTEPVEFTLNITEPDALFKANKGTPTIVACGKSAVIVNIVCANKCALNNDNITVLVKDGVDLTINEKRSSSNGKLTVSGSGVTDGGIYSLNLADEGASNRLTIKLTCTDDAGGWNSGTISSELRDSLGKTYREWSISRYNVDDENESVSYTYNLGQNIPTMFILKPDFGGGFTFRDYTVKLEASMNGKSILNQEKKSNSYPFSSSDNMYYYFSETGYARVAVADNDGNYEWKNYDSVRSAWNAAQSSNKIGLIQLTSPWLLDSRLILQDNKKVKIDLGGYIIRRNIDGLQDDGEVIKINGGAVLDIVDTCPDRSSCVAFKGGGIVGGRSSNGGGNIHIGGGTYGCAGVIPSSKLAVWTTRFESLGSPIQSIRVLNSRDAPKGWEPANTFAGGSACNLSTEYFVSINKEAPRENKSITMPKDGKFLYFLPSVTYTGGTKYVAGVSYFATCRNAGSNERKVEEKGFNIVHLKPTTNMLTKK